MTFFGYNVGSYTLGGFSLEHEGVGYGLLIGAFYLKKKLGKWFFPLVALGFILTISEPLFVDWAGNVSGSVVSALLGMLGVIFVSRFGGRNRR